MNFEDQFGTFAYESTGMKIHERMNEIHLFLKLSCVDTPEKWGVSSIEYKYTIDDFYLTVDVRDNQVLFACKKYDISMTEHPYVPVFYRTITVMFDENVDQVISLIQKFKNKELECQL